MACLEAATAGRASSHQADAPNCTLPAPKRTARFSIVGEHGNCRRSHMWQNEGPSRLLIRDMLFRFSSAIERTADELRCSLASEPPAEQISSGETLVIHGGSAAVSLPCADPGGGVGGDRGGGRQQVRETSGQRVAGTPGRLRLGAGRPCPCLFPGKGQCAGAPPPPLPPPARRAH